MNNSRLSRWRLTFSIFALAATMVVPARLLAQTTADAAGSEQLWTPIIELPANRPAAALEIRAERFKGFQLNPARMRKALGAALSEKIRSPRNSDTIVELPKPDGTLARFRFVEAPVMAPELAALFPEIKTYVGEGVDDPAVSVRFDFTPAGFHAQVLSPEGTYYVDPAFRNDASLHASYYKRDHSRGDGFQCLVQSDASSARPDEAQFSSALAGILARSGGNLRTYRIAVATTGEYTTFHGGTVSGGLAAVVTAINRVTGVYETELAIRFELVANNHLLIHTNASGDPFSNGNPSLLLAQNQTTIDNIIGPANYDIGHVFSTAGGGLAALGVVCVDGMKAQGETGTTSPIGDAFYIDYVAHEIGHQFGANHTFNSSTSNCGGGNRNGSTAYERGSGTTIMSYAGICGSDNVQANSDPFFHSASFDEILGYSTGSGNGCAVITSTGNNAPTVSAGANYLIPQGTPFALTATGSDPDGDPLTYCWEERDLGPATSVNAPDNGGSPLFRVWPPTTNAVRTFPRLENLLANSLSAGEILPTTSRTMNFRVTARDNRAGGGGVNTADMQVTVTASAGPFQVTSHDFGGTFSGVQTVTWNNAGTAGAPVNTANVNILLSTNGGQTFPIMLLANTPNDGAQTVVLPNLSSSMARIKVEAVDNIYFDVGNADFNLIPDIPTPLVTVQSTALIAENCLAPNNAIDPDETVTVNFTFRNIGTANLTNLVATLRSTNGVVAGSGPKNVGALIAGGGAVTVAFTFTAAGSCGDVLNAVLDLNEGGSSLGSVSRAFNLGGLVAANSSHANPAAVTIPDLGTSGASSPYPSTIGVSGVHGAVSKVTVTLKGFTHSWPADLDVLLVGPSGQTLVLLSDAGGGNAVEELTLTFDDAAASTISDVAAPFTGNFKPTNYGGGDTFAPPAPAGPYGATLAVFNGLNPNGNWSLYIQDDASQDIGTLTQGWQLNLTTSNSVCCGDTGSASELVLTQFSSAPAVNVGGNVIFSLIVSNAGPDVASDVVVTNLLPSKLDFIFAAASQGTFANIGGAQVFQIGALPNHASATLTVEASALTAGSCSNLAFVSCNTLDPNVTNNAAARGLIVNSYPLLSSFSDIVTNEDAAIGPLLFTINDAETPAAALALSVTSSDPNIFPVANMIFDGTGANRSLTLNPVLNRYGDTLVTVSVFDGLATTQRSFTVTYLPVNDPPALAPVPGLIITEGQSLVYTNVASDPETPPQMILFSLSGAPAGATVNPVDGVFSWTPTELQGGSTNLIRIVATDDGVPSLSATQAFTVIVRKTNSAPTLPAISELVVIEGEMLRFTNLASDADLPVNLLTYSLRNAPANATVHPQQGIFSWTPSEVQGGTSNFISFVVTDNGTPSLSTTQNFAVIVLKTNSAPVLTAVPNFIISEGRTLIFTNLATDSDLPADTLFFSLENAPWTASIDPNTGVFTWAAEESDGGTTNLMTVVVSDNGLPGMVAKRDFTVVVLETNLPPVFAVIQDVTLNEGETVAFLCTAWDQDVPANGLSFTLLGAPTNATIDASSGWFSWTPEERQGPSTNRITVRVSDNGQPSLSATQSFTVVVLELNEPPILAAVSDVSILEGAMLRITNVATDADLPSNQLTFSLQTAPANATINPSTGLLSWTPNEDQGSGSYLFSVRVADNGVPSLEAIQSFTVFVVESNRAPVLTAIADSKIHVGTTLFITNSATDLDTPPNLLTFSLDADAPQTASIDFQSGLFSWTPTDADANQVHSITVRVTDDGVPALDDAKTFLVTVVSRPMITDIRVTNNVAHVTWTALAGQGYRLQFKTNWNDGIWSDISPDVIATGNTASSTNSMGGAKARFYRVRVLP